MMNKVALAAWPAKEPFMNKSYLAVLALGALMLAPGVASADHRFGTDRGGRYSGGGGGWSGGGGYRSSSRGFFDVSIGFGSGGYRRGGYSYTNLSFGSSPRYYRGGYTSYSAPVYCPPPVVVYEPRIVYAPPPRVVYVSPAPAPVVYYPAPQAVYTSSYYYSSGGYYCGR
jgi:hypothetical protein